MEDIIHFAQYTHTPKLWQSLTYEDIINKLPCSKQILTKLNDYFNLYPDFQLKLRTNLWRIDSNPANTLEKLLPIDLWYKIDSYISESRFDLLIRKCKIYYIILIQSQIKDGINRYSKFIKDTTFKQFNTYVVNTRDNHLFYYAKQNISVYKEMERNINNYKDKYISS